MFESGRVKYLLCHPASAGAGIDLSFADASLYVGVSSDYVNLKQSGYRIVPQGEAAQKTNYFLLCPGVDRWRWQRYLQRERNFEQFYLRGEAEREVHTSDQGEGEEAGQMGASV